MTPLLYMLFAAVTLLGVALLYAHYRHQSLLKARAHLMREAIHCKDFSFRLPTNGLFFGERALQAALNDFSCDISNLMAQQEVETWQRLTRVLTHEVMNAATPISSIAQTYLSDPNIKGSPYEEGIEAIYQSTVGMTNFVLNFRKITSVQEPLLTDVDVNAMLHSLKKLYPNMAWHVQLPPDFTLKADEGMLRQVLINLAKNAAEAGAQDMDVRLAPVRMNKAHERHNEPTLLVSNNGAPIPAGMEKEIFTPFFTTKREGTGIGLTLSRQMMMKQGIALRLADQNVPGFRVTFVMNRLV